MPARHISRFLLMLATAAMLGFPPAARGDDATPSGLSVRQRRYVSARMQEFERRISGLIETLEKEDPQRAARLNAALQKSKELSLQQRMEASASLLDQLDLDRATEQQRAILDDLGQVLALLADDETEEDRLAKRLQQLQAWREQVVKLLKDESDQLRESDKVANPERTLQQLQRDIQAVQELIARQDQLIRDNQRVRIADLNGLSDVGRDQGQLRADTAQLADQIAAALPSSLQPDPADPANGEPTDVQPGEGKPAEGKPADQEPGDSKPSDGKPSDGKPSDGKPGDAKPGDAKPNDGKPGDGKPSDGKPGDGKPGDGKPGDGKPGDGKPGDARPGEQEPDDQEPDEKKPGGLRPKKPPQQPGDQGQDKPDDAALQASNQPGSQPLRQAAAHQGHAQSRLNNSRGKKAEEDQRRALAELRRALKQLEAERSRVAALTPELSKDLADRQAGTSEQTGKLGDEMARAGKPNGGKPNQGKPNEGQPNEGQPNEGQPDQGQPNPVQQAQDHMENAERDLQDQRPDQAGPDQQAAIEDLDRGLQDIDKELRDLQDQQHKQRVAGLLERYQAMLARQKDATQATAIIEQHRQENGSLRRSDLIMVRHLSEEENALAELAEEALDEILADGTSSVFPRIAAQLRDDLRRVGSRLEQRSTGRDTHIVQLEIESTLEELIEALGEAQQQGPPGEQNPAGQPKPPGEQPPGEQEKKLLPDKAELKLIRAAQRRVNRLTEAFQQRRGDQPLDDLRRNEVHNIADRQAEISEMTKQLAP